MALINDLMSTGDDLLSNYAQVFIPNVSFLGTSINKIQLRVTGCDLPERANDFYEFTKRGMKAKRASGVVAQDNSFSIKLRIDKYMECYKAFVTWINFIQNNETGARASDAGTDGQGGASTYRTTMEIATLKNLEDTTPIDVWTFEGAYPVSIDGISFDEEGGDPIECTVSFDCTCVHFPS